jgi:cation transport regulator ChaB
MPLPESLPEHGKTMWDEVYNAARGRGASESSAAKQAWGVVKKFYRKKSDGSWIRRKAPRELHAARGRVVKV